MVAPERVAGLKRLAQTLFPSLPSCGGLAGDLRLGSAYLPLQPRKGTILNFVFFDLLLTHRLPI